MLESEAPPFRRVRVFAFDPSLALKVRTAGLQVITLMLPWDGDQKTGKLGQGPIGEYIEVIDIDPASGMFYPPVDLEHPALLAQDGLTPSEGNPQFHQQMVYAVSMTTIRHFERALGRVALWAPLVLDPTHPDNTTGKWQHRFVRRLRIYPHALRDQNAYYSPTKRALLFGYFPVGSKDENNTPGTTVFTCLSHDIVVHEVTHALLDGLHPRFNEPSHSDVHAFHEAFADIVALFQHFSYPEVLRHQIAQTRGDLRAQNLLSQLAQEFGRATGHGSSLRDALGSTKDGVWKPRTPDPHALDGTREPHARGAILVAAVFRAFLLRYDARTADLFRIATQGTGVLPKGDIHPDLAKRLADEAASVAESVLLSSIRALDYCPPVNITFGDYLRAYVTADLNHYPEDDTGRVAIIESFREWGIYPRGIRSMSVEALRWPSGEEVIDNLGGTSRNELMVQGAMSRNDSEQRRRTIRNAIEKLYSIVGDEVDDQDGLPIGGRFFQWDLDSDRLQIWRTMQTNARAVRYWMMRKEGAQFAKAFGLVLHDDPLNPRRTIYRGKKGLPTLEVHSVRTAVRRSARGAVAADLVIEFTQRRRGYFDSNVQDKKDSGELPIGEGERADFKFRGGCTVVIDITNRTIRHVIRSASVDDDDELKRVRNYLTGEADPATNAFDGLRALSLSDRSDGDRDEPFAMLHRHDGGL